MSDADVNCETAMYYCDFSGVEPDTYLPTLLKREQWMGHAEKRPFSSWVKREHP